MAEISTSTIILSCILYISIISLSVYEIIEDDWDFGIYGRLINALFLIISFSAYLYGKINNSSGFIIVAWICSFICLFVNWIYTIIY